MKKSLFIALFAAILLGQSQADNLFQNNAREHISEGALVKWPSGSDAMHTMAVWSFDGNNRYDAQNTLFNSVVNGLRRAGRFEIVDRESLKYILNEQETVKYASSAKTIERIEQGRIKGAQYILFGYVNTASVEKTSSTNKDKTTYHYKAQTSLNIKIVNVETGEITTTTTLTEDASITISDSGGTREEAWNKVCGEIRSAIKEYIKNRFPMPVNIVNIESAKRGKVYEVLIDKGNGRSVAKRDEVIVYEIISMQLPGGKTRDREKEIANMVVKKVEGQDFSVCKVKKGGEDLFKRLKNGSPIKCRVYGKRDIIKIPKF
ncbi:MAG TPA: hypothetical protein ENJ95_13260 [Bacteroidetes bacterium]|nr:hypothetical protein [Bacteroidota bacterium]